MPLMTVGTGAALIRGHYHEKVLATQPIAYWPFCEAAGTTARCLVNPAQNGTYQGPTLANAFSPTGNLAPLFDGLNDYVQCVTATLVSRFNPSEGTILVWAKVLNVGVWTDGAERRAWTCQADANNYLIMRKSTTNNWFQALYRAGGGAVEGVLQAGLARTDWMCWAYTWSKTANQIELFLDGVSAGIDTSSGIWVGAPVVFDFGGQGALANWSGWLSDCIVWDRKLSLATVRSLAVV